jgi:hypothetical protein
LGPNTKGKKETAYYKQRSNTAIQEEFLLPFCVNPETSYKKDTVFSNGGTLTAERVRIILFYWPAGCRGSQ